MTQIQLIITETSSSKDVRVDVDSAIKSLIQIHRLCHPANNAVRFERLNIKCLHLTASIKYCHFGLKGQMTFKMIVLMQAFQYYRLLSRSKPGNLV